MIVALVLPGAGTFAQGVASGSVVDSAGRPIKGATVVARNPQASPDTVTLVTDKRGRYAVVGLRGGTWVFIAGAYGYEPAQLTTRIGGLRVNIVPELRLAKTPGPPAGALEGVDARGVLDDLESAGRLLRDGDVDGAIGHYRTLLSKAPALTAVHLLIGDACAQKGDTECAIAEYGAALEAGTAPDRARLGLARARLARNETQAALALLIEATSSPDAGADTWVALGDAYAQAGDEDEAERAYRRAEQMDPEARRKSG